jgi:hypothetical protein
VEASADYDFGKAGKQLDNFKISSENFLK